jgi:hypothetical protein
MAVSFGVLWKDCECGLHSRRTVEKAVNYE